MYVLRADTGASFDVNIPSNAYVELLKELLAPLASLPPSDQILLCEGTKLEGKRTLESYGLPSKEKDVFLFNRRVLDFSANLPEEVVLGPIELQFPQFKQPIPTKEEESAPLLFALKTYECQFLHHLQVAQAIHDVIEKRVELCRSCFTEERVQVRGIESAVINLNDHMRQLAQSYSTLMAYILQQRSINDDLLRTFEADLAKLRDVPVQFVMSAQQKTLLDYVPEVRLRKWAEECRTEHEQLKARSAELEVQVMRLQDEVETENKRPHDVDFKALNDKLFTAGEAAKDVLVRLQMFFKDHENVRARVDEALRHVSHNQPMWGLCDGFDDIRKVHETQISMLQLREQETKDLLTIFARSKTSLTRSVYTRLRAVSSFQSRIRDVSNTVVAMGEAVNRLRAAFTQLSIVKNMPQAYQGSIQEIIRRRGFGRKVRREVTKVAEIVATLREKELPKREVYHAYFRYLPKELVAITGLADPLPQFELSLPPFDTRLPNIESGSSGEDDDFTIVPFSDDPSLPKMQPFERENALFNNSSGSRDSKGYTGNSYNTSGAGVPAALPVGSPSNVDVIKLQRDLSVAKEATLSYAERIKSLETKLNSTYTQATNAEEALRQYKEKYELATSRLEEVSKTQKTTITVDIEDLKAQLTQKDETLREKEKLNFNYEQSVKTLSADVVSTQTALERAKDMISSMEASESFLKSQTMDLEAKLRASQSTVTALQTELGQIQEKLTTSDSSLQHTREAITSQFQRVREQLEEDVKDAVEAKVAAEANLKNLINDRDIKITKLTTELQARDSTISAKEQQIAELTQQAYSMREQVAGLEHDLQQQKLENSKLTTTNCQTESNLQAALSSVDAELQEARTSHQELLRKFEDISEHSKEKDSVISNLSTELEKVQLSAAHKEGTIMAQEEQLTSLQDALQQSFSRSTYLETEVSSLQTSLTASVNKVEQSFVPKEDFDKLTEKLAKKEVESQEVANQLANYSKKNLDTNKAISSLERKLQDAEEGNKQTHQQLERQKGVCRQLEEEQSKTKKLITDINDNLRRYDANPPNDRPSESGDISRLSSRMQSVLAAFDVSKAELASLYAKNIDCEAQLARLRKAHTLLEQSLLIKGQENDDLQRNISDMQNFMAALEISQADRTSDRISLRSFVHGDLALFTRNAQGFYEALNIASPNYYLSEYSISLLEDKKSPQPFIFGQIVELDKGKADNVHNPYKLAMGTEYHEVTITKVS